MECMQNKENYVNNAGDIIFVDSDRKNIIITEEEELNICTPDVNVYVNESYEDAHLYTARLNFCSENCKSKTF